MYQIIATLALSVFSEPSSAFPEELEVPFRGSIVANYSTDAFSSVQTLLMLPQITVERYILIAPPEMANTQELMSDFWYYDEESDSVYAVFDQIPVVAAVVYAATIVVDVNTGEELKNRSEYSAQEFIDSIPSAVYQLQPF